MLFCFHGQLYITSKTQKYDFLTLEKIKNEFTTIKITM
jgi:hypothetical protein